jgi:hypothetical protein
MPTYKTVRRWVTFVTVFFVAIAFGQTLSLLSWPTWAVVTATLAAGYLAWWLVRGRGLTPGVERRLGGRRPTPTLDEIQFTVFRPKTVPPGEWFTLLAFAHLAERRAGTSGHEPDPIDGVRQQAYEALKREPVDYRDTSVDALLAVPRNGEITLVPDVPGIEFNPRQFGFVWEEDVHRADFRIRASGDLDGKAARGCLSAYLGAILLAEVDLAIKVDSKFRLAEPSKRAEAAASTARPYRKIFPSYSHEDTQVVEQFEWFVETFGDRYLRDVRELRSGEEWDPRLMEFIREADIFQLFWSSNSMHSEFVRKEWEHALTLKRPNFIRPTYWEEPLPETPDHDLPPQALRKLHFTRIPAAVVMRWAGETARSARPSKSDVPSGAAIAERAIVGLATALVVAVGLPWIASYYYTATPKLGTPIPPENGDILRIPQGPDMSIPPLNERDILIGPPNGERDMPIPPAKGELDMPVPPSAREFPSVLDLPHVREELERVRIVPARDAGERARFGLSDQRNGAPGGGVAGTATRVVLGFKSVAAREVGAVR